MKTSTSLLDNQDNGQIIKAKGGHANGNQA